MDDAWLFSNNDAWLQSSAIEKKGQVVARDPRTVFTQVRWPDHF